MAKLLSQRNIAIKPNIQATGCNFMCLLGMVQLKSRYVFDPEEVNEIFQIVYGKGYVTEECSVINAPGVCHSAMEYIGISGKAIWLPYGKDSRCGGRIWNPNVCDFTILNYTTTSTSTGNNHFMLGNEFGDKIYDPDYPASNRYVNGFKNWRVWKINCGKLSNEQISSIKKKKGLYLKCIDYVSVSDRLAYMETSVTDEKSSIPNTPMEMTITKGGIVATGGLFEYMASNGGGTIEITT